MTSTSQTIPHRYHTLTPYLIIKNASQAIAFYKHVFGAKEIMRFENDEGKIGHAEIRIGDSVLMLADECPEMNAHAPESYQGSPISMHLLVANTDTTFNKAIQAGASEIRAVSDKFYGDRSGSFTDPFGHTWTVSTHIETLSPEEIQRRAIDEGINLKKLTVG